MTAWQKIDAHMDALLANTTSHELNEIYVRLRSTPSAIIDLQKQLLALSFGCHQSGNVPAAQTLYDATGYIAGFAVKVEEESQECHETKIH